MFLIQHPSSYHYSGCRKKTKKGEKHWIVPYIQKYSLKLAEFYGNKKITLNNRPLCHSAAMLVDYNDSLADKNVTILAERYEERPSVCIQPACI
jgi:hypothetical protein